MTTDAQALERWQWKAEGEDLGDGGDHGEEVVRKADRVDVPNVDEHLRKGNKLLDHLQPAGF